MFRVMVYVMVYSCKRTCVFKIKPCHLPTRTFEKYGACSFCKLRAKRPDSNHLPGMVILMMVVLVIASEGFANSGGGSEGAVDAVGEVAGEVVLMVSVNI